MCRLVRRAVCGITRGVDCVVKRSIGGATARSVFIPADPAKEQL
ncbi:hypothetical protein GGD68_007623 [Paraburkholderia fungorum]|jgi:hypothetical protein|uniref:Uncharacterized protein n=1 Tax=Paraburkholderia fungorum TaxID=134537 RepID=A0AAW3V8A1_9BURK|nr:hypothetical protein [Paraburkholderia fungorum]MBB6206699.1 hypothetical protein [Paraburkholderia fungorum]